LIHFEASMDIAILPYADISVRRESPDFLG
jgi:hypothetical protein